MLDDKEVTNEEREEAQKIYGTLKEPKHLPKVSQEKDLAEMKAKKKEERDKRKAERAKKMMEMKKKKRREARKEARIVRLFQIPSFDFFFYSRRKRRKKRKEKKKRRKRRKKVKVKRLRIYQQLKNSHFKQKRQINHPILPPTIVSLVLQIRGQMKRIHGIWTFKTRCKKYCKQKTKFCFSNNPSSPSFKLHYI